jgi:hypothetical protein
MTTQHPLRRTLLLMTAIATLLAAPTLAASPSVGRNLTYAVQSDSPPFQCDSACSSTTIQQKIIQTTFTPCPPGYVGGYYTVTVTVRATVYINGQPYTVDKTVTLQRTGACVYGVSAGCSQGTPSFATNEFDFANSVRTASASGLLVSPDSASTPYVGQFTLTGYDEQGKALGSFQFTCLA